MTETPTELPISEDLLAILRDPAAVQEPEKYGPDPGKLELVHNSWLVSADTGYKYPIRDGIPIMLIEEGRRWKDTPVEELPVPPEKAEPGPAAAGESDLFLGAGAQSGVSYAVLAGGLLVGLLFFVLLWRYLTRGNDDTTANG